MQKIITKNPRNLIQSFGSIFSNKYLIYWLVRKNLTVTYAQSFVGPLYFILLPLIQTIVFNFFLNNVFEVNESNSSAFLFILISTTFWNFFSSTIIKCGNSYLLNKRLISKVFFDRIIFFIQSLFTSLLNFIINLILMFIIIFVFMLLDKQTDIIFSNKFFFIILFLIYTSFFCLLLGIFIASISIRFRDLLYGTAFMFNLLMFATPVLYPISKLEGFVYKIMLFNPFTFFLEFFRWMFYNQKFDINILIINLCYFLILFFLSNFFYTKSNYILSDEI